MSNYHFIIDFESLSNNAFNCAIVNCAYMVFDWDFFISDPYSFEYLCENVQFRKAHVESQVENHGYKINKSTLEWWKEQGPAAYSQIKPSDSDVSIETICSDILEYLKPYNIKYWWSRSNTFDPIILERIMRDTGNHDEFSKALKFWKVRDTRTWIDAKTDWKLKNSFKPMIGAEDEWDLMFKLHNPIHDVSADILRLQTLIRAQEI